MKLHLLLYFSLLVASSYQDLVGTIIQKAIESAVAGIPEELAIDPLEIEIPENKYLTGNINAKDIIVALKNLNVEFTPAASPYPISIKIDPIDVDLHYISNIKILNSSLLSIFGDGDARVVLSEISVDTKLNASIGFGGTFISLIDLKISLGDGQFTLNGLLNDADFSKQISDILTDNVADIFNEYEPELSPILEEAINKVIADYISPNSTVSVNEIEDFEQVLESIDTSNLQAKLTEQIVYKKFIETIIAAIMTEIKQK